MRGPKINSVRKSATAARRKGHTVKNTVINDKRTKKKKALGKTVPGKRHDKKLADEEDWLFPLGSHLWEDTGHQGYEPEQRTTHRPKKKPRGGELTESEKEHNRAISEERVGIEHSVGGAKANRIVRETFRHRKADFADLVMIIGCGLHNLRLDFPVLMQA